ncbi:MAG TPA: hypothetical protein VGM84_24835 [Steroidobacteraceae bacterium]|jgi:hypothetical protein
MSQEGAWSAEQQQPADLVASILEGYASRGVFAGFRQNKRQARKADFTVRWHYRRVFSILLDEAKASLTLTGLLPQVSAAPHLRRALAAYLRHCAAPERPAHRRIDPEKARVTCYVRSDSLSLRVAVQDGDYEYATRRLVHLVNEIFLDFLRDAMYVEYMVAHLGMNPETGSSL